MAESQANEAEIRQIPLELLEVAGYQTGEEHKEQGSNELGHAIFAADNAIAVKVFSSEVFTEHGENFEPLLGESAGGQNGQESMPSEESRWRKRQLESDDISQHMIHTCDEETTVMFPQDTAKVARTTSVAPGSSKNNAEVKWSPNKSLIKKPVEMTSFEGETLEIWKNLHVNDGSGLEWSCVDHSYIGKRFRRVSSQNGRREGFVVAWASTSDERWCKLEQDEPPILKVEVKEEEQTSDQGHAASAASADIMQSESGPGEMGTLEMEVECEQVSKNASNERHDPTASEASGTDVLEVAQHDTHEMMPSKCIVFRVAFNDGKLEEISNGEAVRGIAAMRGVRIATYGFSPDFAMRQVLKARSDDVLSAIAVTSGIKTQTSTKKNEGGTSVSYTTSETTYDAEWDAGAGDFEFIKVCGQREMNGQTGLSGDYTDNYFPVMASIFNHLPNTKVWFSVADAATGIGYRLSAIAYNRRVWMRSGANTAFYHGGLMLSGDWNTFRRDNALGIGDTLYISRKDGKVLLGCIKGANAELMSSLHSNHHAKARSKASKEVLALEEKRKRDTKALQESTWASGLDASPSRTNKHNKPAKGRKKNKSKQLLGGKDEQEAQEESDHDDEQDIMTLNEALKVCEDKVFLSDWKPKNKSRANIEEQGEVFELETNVISEISPQDANFRYVPCNEMFDDKSDWSNCSQFKRVSCMMRAGNELFFPPVSCAACHGAGMVNSCAPDVAPGQVPACETSSVGKILDVDEEQQEKDKQHQKHDQDQLLKECLFDPQLDGSMPPSTDLMTMGDGVDAEGAAAGAAANSDQGLQTKVASSSKGSSKGSKVRKGHKPSVTLVRCYLCRGTGVAKGDFKYKQELAAGVPFKLKIVANEGSFGCGVIAQERIPADRAVCEYTGEIISRRETLVREKVYHAAGLFYIFDLVPDKWCSVSWVLDATRIGNVARFINHRCCDANLKVVRIGASCSYRSSDGVPGRIVLVSTRDIEAGEPLCYDYQFWPELELSKLVRCICGSSKCKGWVF